MFKILQTNSDPTASNGTFYSEEIAINISLQLNLLFVMIILSKLAAGTPTFKIVLHNS